MIKFFVANILVIMQGNWILDQVGNDINSVIFLPPLNLLRLRRKKGGVTRYPGESRRGKRRLRGRRSGIRITSLPVQKAGRKSKSHDQKPNKFREFPEIDDGREEAVPRCDQENQLRFLV